MKPETGIEAVKALQEYALTSLSQATVPCG
jgi:hypothetical protein